MPSSAAVSNHSFPHRFRHLQSAHLSPTLFVFEAAVFLFPLVTAFDGDCNIQEGNLRVFCNGDEISTFGLDLGLVDVHGASYIYKKNTLGNHFLEKTDCNENSINICKCRIGMMYRHIQKWQVIICINLIHHNQPNGTPWYNRAACSTLIVKTKLSTYKLKDFRIQIIIVPY